MAALFKLCSVVPVTGIEPMFYAPKAYILPLDETGKLIYAFVADAIVFE